MQNSLFTQVDFSSQESVVEFLTKEIQILEDRVLSLKSILNKAEEECSEIESELDTYRNEQRFEQELDESEDNLLQHKQNLQKLEAVKGGQNGSLIADEEIEEAKKLVGEFEARKKFEIEWQKRMEDAFNEAIMSIGHLKKDLKKDSQVLEYLKSIQTELKKPSVDLSSIKARWGATFGVEK